MPTSSSTTSTAKKSSPPGPAGYLLFSLSDFAHDPLSYTRELWRTYGDYVRVPFLPGQIGYLCAHPDAAEHILSTHQDRYGKPDANKIMSLLVGQGILTSEGEFWRRQRRLMQPAFHQKQLAALTRLMVECVESFLQELEQKSDRDVVALSVEMSRLTLKIAGLALFSIDISGESSRFEQAFRSASDFIVHKITNPLMEPLWMPTARNRHYRTNQRTLDQLVLDIIQSRRSQSSDTFDLLSMLMSVRDEETGEGMSDRQLHDEVLTLLVAGHDTLASSLSWTWYLLGQHPESRTLLQDELHRVLNGNAPTFEQLPKLDYTRRVFDESLRLYPPAWGQARMALEADEMGGYRFPKGASILISTAIIHRHPEFWQQPDEFDPDRFLPELTAQRPKFAYFPFGGGQRICIGKSFALMEATIVLAMIAQRFDLILVSDHPVEPDPKFTLCPKYGIKVKVRKRA